MGKRANAATPPSGAKAAKLEHLSPWVKRMREAIEPFGLYCFISFVNLGWARCFDPMKDEHPVSWLLSTLKKHSTATDALNTWLADVVNEGPFPNPNSVTMPDAKEIMRQGLKCV